MVSEEEVKKRALLRWLNWERIGAGLEPVKAIEEHLRELLEKHMRAKRVRDKS